MKQYVVDAFTDKIFHGNPAAVCIMKEWIPEKLMQNIALENNLSETSFAVRENGHYNIRWFTPGGEVDLCGHATLATAFIILNFYEKEMDEIHFKTIDNVELTVKRKDELYEMEFPAYELKEIEVTAEIADALGIKPVKAYKARDILCILDDEESVINLKPDFDKIRGLDGLLVHVSAKGTDVDCVSRSFAPKLNILENPVCGSGHCHIIPYWASKINKNNIVAYQASKRGGTLFCKLKKDKIIIAGKATLFSESNLKIK